jgi:hypothetical protein
VAGQGSLSNYTPTLREKMVSALARNWYGDTRQGYQDANRLMGVADLTPVGMATGMYDAGRDVGAGNYPKAGLNMAMALIPGPNLGHGSPVKGLSKLKKSERGPLGPGVYTSPSGNVTDRYAGAAGQTYTMPDEFYDVYTGAGHDRIDNGWEGFKQDKKRLLAAAEPEKKKEIAAMLDKMWSSDGYPLYAKLRGMYGGDDGAQALFRRAGFDGLSGHVDGPETLLFNEQRLK